MTTRMTRRRSPVRRTSATPGMFKKFGAKSVSTRSVKAGKSNASLEIAKATTDSASLSALIIETFSTCSGKPRCTRLTDSRVSFAALSKSIPGRNSITIRELPSSLEARMDFTPLTRAAAPSRRLVTSVSTVSGAAPG